MRIPIVSATATGPTELAAFDAALVKAGVADRNLICLSSVLPPGAVVEEVPTIERCPGGWGDRLYVVMARMSTKIPGVGVHAGIGWVQDDTGRGLLVEHHAHFKDGDGGLTDLIDTSLEGLQKSRPGVDLPHSGMVTASVTCPTYLTACALVVAVFEAAPWTKPQIMWH